MNQPRLNNRGQTSGGFTLIELMVISGILIVLAALILPMIARAHRAAQVATVKLNLQTISTALENYKHDFPDYPRNPYGLSDPLHPTMYAPRTDPTLAMALLGPGPAGYVLTDTGRGSNYPNGDVDGHDGVGFCATYQVSIVHASTIMNAATSITIDAPGYSLPPTPTAMSLSDPRDQNISITDCNTPATPPFTTTSLNLSRPIQGNYPNGGDVSLLIPSGPSYSYLPPDKFKVQYLRGPNDTQPLPVLLDNFGEPILYFPQYHQFAAGMPLFGSAASPPLYTHQRADITMPIAPPAAPTATSVFWDGPIWWWTPDGGNTWQMVGASMSNPPGGTSNLLLTVMWKLGDTSTTVGTTTTATVPDDVIDGTETPNLPYPYVLISAGPNGAYFDMSDPPPTGTNRVKTDPVLRGKAINDSGNVYNIDQ